MWRTICSANLLRPESFDGPETVLRVNVAHRLRAQDYFELGVILLRKKLYTQATKNLEKAKKAWTGEPEELAQVCARARVGGYRADVHQALKEVEEKAYPEVLEGLGRVCACARA